MMNMLLTKLKYSINNPEYILVLFILAGLITFNKEFAYIGFNNIYVTEFVTVLCILNLAIKSIVSKNLLDYKSWGKSLLINFWPLIILSLYTCIRLTSDLDYGVQALRHSMIFLYIILFIILFPLTIKNEKQLFFIIIFIFIILSSVFNGSKIIIFKLLNYTFNYYEPERVNHIETDTICSSIALLGLLVYHRLFWIKSKIGFLILIFLNVIILILTVKRSAVIGTIPAVILYLFIERKKIKIKNIFWIIGALLVIAIIAIVVWQAIDHEYTNYIFKRLSFKEKNVSWRLQIWNMSWHKFLEKPIFGIGYGPQIIEYPVDGVDANDPHNSILAFLTRHGIFGFILFIYFIVQTYAHIFKEIKINANNSYHYNNALFICLFLTSMIIFSFFNVMLENQYEGIFFYFALSAIYIVRVQKLAILTTKEHTSAKYMNYGLLGLFSVFLLYTCSPFNQIQQLNVYSAKANHWLPMLFKTELSNINTKSQRNFGITINVDNRNANAFSELSWIFPPQANKLNLKKYNLNVESNICLKDIDCMIQYEDNVRQMLKWNCIGTNNTTSLELLDQTHDATKIKFFVMSFHHFSIVNNLIIKNIYISYKNE